MSKYDQLAFASKPNLYLAAPSLLDQSNSGAFTFLVNNLALGGQPIIYGHESSFKLETGATCSVGGNPVFRFGVTTELVMLASLPSQETEVIVASNGSGLFITPTSVVLRLNYIKDESAKSLTAEILVPDWSQKLYITISIGDNQASLTVNNKSTTVILDGLLDSAITSTNIGGTFATGYFILLDGFGVYSRKLLNKNDALNDPTRGHNIYASAVYGANSTDFSTYSSIEAINVNIGDFQYVNYVGLDHESLLYRYQVSANDGNVSYIAVQTNNDSLVVEWDLNGGEVGTFLRYLVVPITSPGSVITFKIPAQGSGEFNMRIENILSGNVMSETPAFLRTTGKPIFPAEPSDSIVNCPPGVIMDFASFEGTWLEQGIESWTLPKSVELIFKPDEAGVIFSSSNGVISTSAQSGYSMWLNGVAVANLTNILMNQWNHLVLINTTPTATTFTLNTNGTSVPTKMRYLLLSSYRQELVQADIEQMYKVSIGVDTITVNEVPVVVAEGMFENSQPFQVFGNVWSIVGAGGN